MANITGQITVNNKVILEVDADPAAGAGTEANMGSLACFDSGSAGSVYIKTGAADTAWSEIDTPENADWKLNGNTLGANTSIGSIDDFDQLFIRNNIELMRTVGSTAAAQALLIGLNATLGGRLQVAATTSGAEFLKQALSPGATQVIKVSRMHRSTTTGAASATFDIAIPSDYNANVTSNAVALQTGGSAGAVGDGASYIRTVHASNLAGTVSILGGVQTDFTYEAAGGMNYSLSASGANVRGTATGVTNRNISWGIYSEILMIAG